MYGPALFLAFPRSPQHRAHKGFAVGRHVIPTHVLGRRVIPSRLRVLGQVRGPERDSQPRDGP